MNILIVHFSKFGHTRLVAEAIAEALGTAGKARVVGLRQVTTSDLMGTDLLVAGTPTHRMNLPEAVQPVLESLPKCVLRDTPVAVFDTSYQMSAFLARFTAAGKLARRLRRLRGRLIIPPETFHVEGREGPLYPGELDRARAWARLILQRLSVTSLVRPDAARPS
jgi:flavodoxin